MDRIIEVKVDGSHIQKDNRYAGVQHEGNVTRLRITFDEGWDGYAKKVTWWDAKGENPVEILLGTDKLEDVTRSTRIYLCYIPPEPLAESGECTFVIDGYIEGRRQRSAADRLVVREAPFEEEAGESTDPTPSQAEQLQEEIDEILGTIAQATTAASSAANSATQAAASAAAAAESLEAIGDAEETATAAAAAAQASAEAAEETAALVDPDQIAQQIAGKGDSLEVDSTDGKLWLTSNGQRVGQGVTVASQDSIPASEKGAAGGVATLDANQKVPAAQLPNTSIDSVEGLPEALEGKQDANPILNKDSLLESSTAALYGLGVNAVPDDVFKKITELAALYPVKTEVILNSCTWTAPADLVGPVKVYAFGGGGSGGGRSSSKNVTNSGGGGGGGHLTIGFLQVSPGDTVTAVIGAGGEAPYTGDGNDGGATTFGSFTAAGGGKGYGPTSAKCGDGGSGGTGGSGGCEYSGGSTTVGAGGSGSYGGGAGASAMGIAGNGGKFGGGGGGCGYVTGSAGTGGLYGGDGSNVANQASEPGQNIFGLDVYDSAVLGDTSGDTGISGSVIVTNYNNTYVDGSGGNGGGGFGSAGGTGCCNGGTHGAGGGGGGVLSNGGTIPSNDINTDYAIGGGGGGFGRNAYGGNIRQHEYESGDVLSTGGAGGGGCGVLGLSGFGGRPTLNMHSEPWENDQIAAGGAGASARSNYNYGYGQEGGQGVVILAYMAKTKTMSSVT